MANRIPTASRLHPNIQKLFSTSSAGNVGKVYQVKTLGLVDRSQLPRPENHVFQVDVGGNQVVSIPWTHLANEAGAKKTFQAALDQHRTDDLSMRVQLTGTVHKAELVAKPKSALLDILQNQLRAHTPVGRAVQKHHAANSPHRPGSSGQGGRH